MQLSIIMPAYNAGKYIRKGLQSIYNQKINHNEFEVIIVNDGSTDNTLQVANEFANKYANLKVINQENQGLSCARNAGLKGASGKWVWFIDADDWIEDRFLEDINTFLESRQEQVLMFKIRECRENDGAILRERKSYNESAITECSGPQMILNEVEKGISVNLAMHFIIQRDYLEKTNIHFVPGLLHEDIEFAHRILIFADRVAYVPRVSYVYLLRTTGSITTTEQLMSRRIESLCKILLLQFDLLKHVHTAIQRKAARRAITGTYSELWHRKQNGQETAESNRMLKKYKLNIAFYMLTDSFSYKNKYRLRICLSYLLPPRLFQIVLKCISVLRNK